MKCIKCECELSVCTLTTAVLYSDWCDECFLNLPLSERYLKCTAEDLKQVEVNRARSAEARSRKRTKKQTEITETNSGKTARKIKKKQQSLGNDLWNYEDK